MAIITRHRKSNRVFQLVMIEKLGGEIVSCSFIIDLPGLGGRQHLEKMGFEVNALCDFEGE